MDEVERMIKELNDKLDNREREFTKMIEEQENQKNELKNQKNELKNELKNQEKEFEDRLKNQKKEFEDRLKNQKKEFEDRLKNQETKIKELNRETKELQSFKQKYQKIKGRFIYKSFYDYILLVFGIPIEENYKNKENLLENQLKKNEIKSKKFEFIINDMKNTYLSQNGESHCLPEENKIMEYILSIYNEYEDGHERDEKKFIKKFFETSHPETEIIELIKKNNEFTLNNNSDKEHLIKEKEKKRINDEINNLLNDVRKQELLKIIKEISSNIN